MSPRTDSTSQPKKAQDIQLVADKLLSESLFPPEKTLIHKDYNNNNDDAASTSSDDSQKKDPLATKVWRMYTKAKDTLPNGVRMENLTWRMMAMTLKTKNAEAEKGAGTSSCDEDAMAVDDSNDYDHQYPHEYFHNEEYIPISAAVTIEQRASPPPADDTTALLSSSAPPYMMDFLRENLELLPEPRNVMVSGSTRASSSTEEIHCTVCLLFIYLLSVFI